MDDIQNRFWDIASCFLDDNRVIAHILSINTNYPAEAIYKDILASKFDKYIDKLEEIADTTKWETLQNWCKFKQYELDSMQGTIWAKGDMRALSEGGWKYGIHSQEEDTIESLRNIITQLTEQIKSLTKKRIIKKVTIHYTQSLFGDA